MTRRSTVHTISGGNLGDAYRLLNDCAKTAIADGKEQISEELLRSMAWLGPTRGVREMAL